MMNIENITIELLYKKIEGALNQEEEQVFQQWISNAEHAAYFEKLLLYYQGEKIGKVDPEEVDIAWNELSTRIQHHRHKARINIRPLMAVAAVVILLIGSLLLLPQTGKNPSLTSPSPSIIPGERTAILQLADGSTFNLQELATLPSDKIAENIRIDSCRLSYLSSSVSSSSDNTTFYNKLIIPRGGEFQLLLEDGTKVWLNSDSYLRYPASFNGPNREVFLEGEAYFEVAKDSCSPFIVHVGKQIITVLGTHFGVTDYPGDDCKTTTLVEGKVKIEFPEYANRTFILTPGYQVAYRLSDAKIECRGVNTEEYVAWRNGKYIFTKKRLEDMLITLSRWYDFEIFFQNAEAKEVLFSGELKRFDEFSKILSLIEKSSDVQFRVHGHSVTVCK